MKHMPHASIFFITIFLWIQTLAPAQSQRNLPSSYCDSQIGKFQFNESFKKQIIKICRKGYVSFIDTNASLPYITYYKINKDRVLGCIKRTDQFMNEDLYLSLARVSTFTKSGFDKGHMTPAADQAWDEVVEKESYYMANVNAQLPSFNRGIWKGLELLIRVYVFKADRDVLVVTGAVYDNFPSSVVKQLRIPKAYYKIILDNSTQRFAAWYLPHTKLSSGREDLHRYRVSLHDLELKTSLDLRAYHHYSQTAVENNMNHIKEFFIAKHRKCGY